LTQLAREAAVRRWIESSGATSGNLLASLAAQSLSGRIQAARDVAISQLADLRAIPAARQAARELASMRPGGEFSDRTPRGVYEDYRAIQDEAIVLAIEDGPFDR
jgi:hypothetical protein